MTLNELKEKDGQSEKSISLGENFYVQTGFFSPFISFASEHRDDRVFKTSA